MWWVAIIVGTLLAGCAGLQSGAPAAQEDEPISVQPSQSAGYDYLVIVRNIRNLGFDPSDQAARGTAALSALKSQCDTPQIIGETVVKSDRYFQGDQARSYEVKVRC